MKQHVLVIDEGRRALERCPAGTLRLFPQSYGECDTPGEDRVEHDAEEIYDKTIVMCKNALKDAGLGAGDIAAIGITNQRATSVVWDKNTGKRARAIVWQDSRTGDKCREINESEWGEKARKATGWTVAPGVLFAHAQLDEKHTRDQSRDRKGTALFGTIDLRMAHLEAHQGRGACHQLLERFCDGELPPV